jgi:quercetin dioxygenase-like cupin family protein
MKTTVLAIALIAALGGGAAQAQADHVHKTTLQTDPFPEGGRHTVLVHTDVDVGGLVGRHTHPGLEMAYIEKGEAVVSIEGRPPLHLTAGGSFDVPPVVVHSVQNVGPGELTIVSTYVVDPNQPIASPAP